MHMTITFSVYHMLSIGCLFIAFRIPGPVNVNYPNSPVAPCLSLTDHHTKCKYTEKITCVHDGNSLELALVVLVKVHTGSCLQVYTTLQGAPGPPI